MITEHPFQPGYEVPMAPFPPLTAHCGYQVEPKRQCGKLRSEHATAKPPRGCKPREFWLLDRAQDLSRAIHEQLAQGFEGRLDLDRLASWIVELRQIVSELDGTIAR